MKKALSVIYLTVVVIIILQGVDVQRSQHPTAPAFEHTTDIGPEDGFMVGCRDGVEDG